MNSDPERLHVIRCYERLPPLPGGMERHIAELTAAQRASGVRVTELFNRGEPAGESIQLWRGHKLDQLRPYLLRSALFYAAAVRRRFDFSDGRIRVVHIHGDWPAFLFGSMFGQLIGAKAVAGTLHEWMRGPPSLYSLALKHCDPIFTTGLQEARCLAQLTGKRIVHFPSAPSEIFFSKPKLQVEATDVIVAGSLVPRKNLELVLAAAERRPNLKFAVYGGGPEHERIEAIRLQKALNNLGFHGPVGQEALHAAMCSSKLFLNTATAEGSPTAALEAMACGLPVVLTPSNNYSGIVEQGANGWVTSGWDADELMSAMDHFLRNPSRLRDAGRAARAKAARHHWALKARGVTDLMLAAATDNGAQR